MGQQQLLLLVLGIVIVGLAVVVGIQAFSENQKKANADSLVNDGIRIASDAQAWSLKPKAFGGPDPNADPAEGLADATFAAIGLDASGTTQAATYSNTNGTYTITGGTGCITITGDNGIGAFGDAKNNTVHIVVTGTSQDDIDASINAAATLACDA